MPLVSCPVCAEDEELKGSRIADGAVVVTCQRCGHSWQRGQERCATCGGSDLVTRPRALTSHGRATVQSVVGFQEVPLCASCDVDELDASLKHARAVTADYLPAALHKR
jgi:Zn ribbon nucleic-acid-binding protein